MVMKINADVAIDGYMDLFKKEIRNVRLQNLGSDPGTPVIGQMYFNTGTNRIRSFNGSTWDEMGVGTAGYVPGGTDVAVADGGTGASTAAAARTNLGLVIGTDVAAQSSLANYAPLASPVLTGSPTAPTQTAGDNSTKIATTAYVATAVSAGFAANDAMVFKGGIDASANPNYPAATSAGELWRITVAGKIGGAAGIDVRAGDTITAVADGLASGNQATVGASWVVTQGNLDQATDTAVGFVELATVAEANAKSDNTRAVTPASLIDFAKVVSGTFGNGSLTSFPITHNLGTPNIIVDIYLASTGAREFCEVTTAGSTTQVTLSGWTTPPASNAYIYVITAK